MPTFMGMKQKKSINRWKFGKKQYTIKVVSILKKIAREMSHSGKVSRTFEFLQVF